MDLTTNAQRARWAIDALREDAYIRRKFARELSELSALASEPTEAASALRSKGEAIGYIAETDAKPGVATVIYDSPDRIAAVWADRKAVAIYLHPATPASAPDWSMAQHWIDRYAGGIDDELQLDRVADALGLPDPTPEAQGHE